MVTKITVKDVDKLNMLIESVSDGNNEWSISDYDTCFCGHANRIFGRFGSVGDYIFDDAENCVLEKLIMPEGWHRENNERYSRENAVRVLTSIRDTGMFEW